MLPKFMLQSLFFLLQQSNTVLTTQQQKLLTTMATKISEALKQWRETQIRLDTDPEYTGPRLETDPTKAKVVKLQFRHPLIKKMDNTLSTLTQCEFLSLSTNDIDKITGIAGMRNLKILSLGRNNIKMLTGLDTVADTLEQLWLSYNAIEKLAGIEKLQRLKVFYISNNRIKDWAEIARLGTLPVLSDVVLKGNPVRKEDMTDQEYVKEVKKRIPNIKILDGEPCGGDDEED